MGYDRIAKGFKECQYSAEEELKQGEHFPESRTNRVGNFEKLGHNYKEFLQGKKK